MPRKIFAAFRIATLAGVSSIGIIVAAQPAFADTTVNTASTTPLQTSTAGNVTVEEEGSIETDNATAITVDSSNDVTIVDTGSIHIEDGDGIGAILVQAGTFSTISNDGQIFVLEDYAALDDDGNGIADNEIANGENRFGIQVLPGSGTSGTITNSGSIDVEGRNSVGIGVGGDYTGTITNTYEGIINVVGENSVGISTKAVDGDLNISGRITVAGEGAKALVVDGDVSGTITIQGTLSQSVAYAGDDGSLSLPRRSLRVEAPAVEILGNVQGGILVATRPLENDSNDADEDDDGVDDTLEGTGSIVAYGNGPALQIGGANDISVGTVTGQVGTYSLVVDGAIQGNSYYSSTDAKGVVIGGQGGNVSLAGGIGVSGLISATTFDQEAVALLVNVGSSVPNLYNSGSISASISSPGDGAAYAIQDLSGTLTSVENTGLISATGSNEDTLRAIDLSANTTGVVISQYMNTADIEARATYEEENDEPDPTVYTSIRGDIVTGSGNDTLTASAGKIDSRTFFGAGDDTLVLTGDSKYTGKVFFGSGFGTATLVDSAEFHGTLDLAGQAGLLTLSGSSIYSGTFASASGLAVQVNSGASLGAQKAEEINFGTLSIAAGGTLNVFIDAETGTSSHFNVATATFEDGAKLSATISDLSGAEGQYTILTAGSLTGTLDFDPEAALLPYIFKGSVNTLGNELILDISKKSVEELGLSQSTGAAWNAIFVAAGNDDVISDALLQIDSSAKLEQQLSQMLPDHAGGVFDVVTRSSRLGRRHLSESSGIFEDYQVQGWIEPIVWGSKKDADETGSYETSGWGTAIGLERKTGLGIVGFNYTWSSAKIRSNRILVETTDEDDEDGLTENWTGSLKTGQHDFGLHWRLSEGKFLAHARIGGGIVAVDSTRTVTVTVDDFDYSGTASGSWNGWYVSGSGGVSHGFDVSEYLTLRKAGSIEYFRLTESAYEESGGGEATDLAVAKRTSEVITATSSLTASYRFGRQTRDGRPLTLELEGGRRQVIGGELGTTVANFADGDAFSIAPSKIRNAWLGEARLLAGGWDFTWQLSGQVEKTIDGINYSTRASLSVAF